MAQMGQIPLLARLLEILMEGKDVT